MFEKKQIIYSETQGVCQVENIVSLSASRRERKIPYYVLRPVFDKSRVSYIPVENHQVKLRELFTREEAEALQGTEEMKKDEKLTQAVDRMAQQQPQQAIHKFVLGNKELEGKTAEFQYDKGWYSITDIVGEERNVIYKSRNAQEAYMKWNVYIGRKKERPSSAKNSDADHGSRADGNRANDSREHRSRDFREKRDMTDRRGNNRGRH